MTIQNLYTQYLEGKITQQKFLYEARRDQNLTMISSTNSFDDVVKILKNKSIISEKAYKESTGKQEVEVIAKTIDMVNPYEYTRGMNYELDLTYTPAGEANFKPEDIAKAQKKVLTNLTKNPQYYCDKMHGKGEVSDEWVEVTKKEIEKIGKGKASKGLIREGIETNPLIQMGYSNSDIEDFMDEWEQGGSKLPKKVKDYLDNLYQAKENKNLTEYGEDEFNRSPEMYSGGKSTREVGGDFEGAGLIVVGRTQIDNNQIADMLDETDYHGVWNTREGYWFFPEDESTLSYLEADLDEEFAKRGINARFEGQFNESLNKKINEIGMFNDPIGYEKGRKSRIEQAKDLLKDAGVGEEAIDKFIDDNMFAKGNLTDLAQQYVNAERRPKRTQNVTDGDPEDTEMPSWMMENKQVEESTSISKKEILQALIPLAANKGEIKQYMQSLSKSGDTFDNVDDYAEDFKNYVADKSLEEHGEYFDRVSDVNIDQSPLEEKRLRIYEKYSKETGIPVDNLMAMVREAKEKMEEAITAKTGDPAQNNATLQKINKVSNPVAKSELQKAFQSGKTINI